MKSIEDLSVFAYLTPSPYDEDGYFEEEWISWLPGYLSEATEDGAPSYYRDENMALLDRIETYAAQSFKLALARMWPLLEGIYIQQIQIAIDFTNYQGTNSLAGYDLQRSNPAKGCYVFHLDQQLLLRYLSHLQDKESIGLNMNIWEHELIHLLDHWQLVHSAAFANSELPANNLEHYLLKFREEGLANLFDLLDGKLTKFTSIAQAKDRFFARYAIARESLGSLETSTQQERNTLYSGYDFYEVGPWLILEMLQELFFVFETPGVAHLEEKIAAGNVISDYVKLEIIKLAFLIDNSWFLSRIKPILCAV